MAAENFAFLPAVFVDGSATPPFAGSTLVRRGVDDEPMKFLHLFYRREDTSLASLVYAGGGAVEPPLNVKNFACAF